MYPIITRFSLESVHRTRNVSFNLTSQPLIKKSLHFVYHLSFQYEIVVKLSLIINQRSLNTFVWKFVKFVRILTLRQWERLSNMQLIAGVVVTGQYRQLEFCMWILQSSLYPTINDIFLNFLQFGQIQPGVSNRVTRSSYS